MEEDGQTTPFWAQTTTYFNSTKNRRRSNPLSFCLNSGVLMVLLLIIAMITILFVIPSLLSFTSQVFRPNLVRKSWDNLNLVLVLFAILCGILGRKKDDGIAPNAMQVPEEPVQPQWFGYSDKDNETVNMPKALMKRNSSSYPDLRQESSWAFPDDNWRSFDDNYAYNHRLESNYVHRPRYGQQDSGVKTIPVDTYVVRRQEPLSPPPQSPPARQARRTFQSVAQKENSDIKEMEFTKIQSPPPLPPHSLYTPPARQVRRTFQSVAQKENSDIKEMEFPPPPPPPSEPHTNGSDKKVRRSERKRSGGAKDMATTLASLYNSRKRKMKQKSKENFDDIFPSPVYLQPVPAAFPPPPSPPPPPPASKFQQLFKKGIKTKRIRSVSVSSSKQQPPPPTPPPPPPPPHPMSPSRTYKHKTHRQRPMTQPPPPPPPPMSPLHTYKHKTHRPRPMTQPPPPSSEFSRPTEPMTPDRPPLPSKLNSFYNESSSSVNQPPSIPMPPPPPQPPFKVSGFKFVVEGDYVRLQSIQSSRSNSPDFDSTDTPPTSTPATPTSGGTEPVVSVFCPSPDVNTKADTFIARFRAGLRMEKAKSFNEKQVMGNSVPTQTSNLMPK